MKTLSLKYNTQVTLEVYLLYVAMCDWYCFHLVSKCECVSHHGLPGATDMFVCVIQSQNYWLVADILKSLKMGVVRPMSAEYSCNYVVMASGHSRVARWRASQLVWFHRKMVSSSQCCCGRLAVIVTMMWVIGCQREAGCPVGFGYPWG